MMKYKNILRAMAVAAISVSTLLVNTSVVNAATCYTETGTLQVSPNTHVCPTSPGPSITFVNSAGQPITSPLTGANANNCYAARNNGPDRTVYILGDCAALESLRLTAAEAACESPPSNGVWEASRSEQTTRFQCVCPLGGTVSTGTICILRSNSGVNGANNGVPVGPDLEIEGSGDKLVAYAQDGINLFTVLAGLAITAMVIVGGIQYSSAGGNPQAAAGAKKKITNAFIALLTLIFVFTFLQWLVPGGIFG